MYNVGDEFKVMFGSGMRVTVTIIDKDEDGFRAPECKYLLSFEDLLEDEPVIEMAGDEFITVLIKEGHFEEDGRSLDIPF